ncbi:MarR family transcriptional regulator [Terriglobus sp. 2YAB30_2]|uniref:MarR family transcriptional regulator n=1 Tax=unclassified Terriglobus TaxID=2628988 RepID=UPI003F9D9A55
MLKPSGLTNGQFSILMSLNRPEPAPMASVANLLAMDRTTLTAALKPLERRELLRNEANPNDRRSRMLSLTAEGHAALQAALPLWTRAHAELDKAVESATDLRSGLMALSR